MYVAKVIGNVVATQKDERLVGYKLLIIQPLDPKKAFPNELPRVAIDTVGAGMDEAVLVVLGSAARKAVGKDEIPVDAAIVGIVDTLEVER